MNSLQEFLSQHPVDNVTETLTISDRLREHPFTIRAMTGPEYNSYQNICIENANNAKKRSFNTKKFNELVVVNHTLEPNFKDAEWLSKMGTMNSGQVLGKTLLAGEIQTLSDAIMTLSGFGIDMNEEIDEAKNSLGEETQNPGTATIQ